MVKLIKSDRMKRILIMILTISIFQDCCDAKRINYTNSDFERFCNLFPTIQTPYQLKELYYGPIEDNRDSKCYLGFADEDLKIDDGSYNADDNVWVPHVIDNKPYIVGKIEMETNVILIYNHTEAFWSDDYPLDTYYLQTFNLDGTSIAKIEIAGFKTGEEDNRSVVFLTNQTFRLFDYKVNPKHTTKVIDAQGRTQYVTHKEIPWTICTITEYRITDAGKIEKTGWTETKLLKESVTYYRQYHEDSDDPMNEYK